MIYLVVESSLFFNAGEIVEYTKDGMFRGMVWASNGRWNKPISKENLEYIGEL